MKLVLIQRHNMLLPAATVGSHDLVKYCVCLHCYMPLALTEACSMTASPLIMQSSSLHTVKASGPFMQYFGSKYQVTAVLDIADLHRFGSCRGRMISIILKQVALKIVQSLMCSLFSSYKQDRVPG